MKFNPNQRYTRWSIRRLSVGVASVVVASGFFVLVGQPSFCAWLMWSIRPLLKSCQMQIR